MEVVAEVCVQFLGLSTNAMERRAREWNKSEKKALGMKFKSFQGKVLVQRDLSSMIQDDAWEQSIGVEAIRKNERFTILSFV